MYLFQRLSLPPGARILIIRLRSIGDIVLLTPALQLLKHWRPDLKVSVVIEPRLQELLAGNSDVDEMLSPGEGRGWTKLTSIWRAIRTMRQRRFDLCLNLHGGPTSVLLTRWSGVGLKVGFDKFRAQGIYGILVPDGHLVLGQGLVHTAEHQASLFFYLGLPRTEIPPASRTARRALAGVSPS